MSQPPNDAIAPAADRPSLRGRTKQRRRRSSASTLDRSRERERRTTPRAGRPAGTTRRRTRAPIERGPATGARGPGRGEHIEAHRSSRNQEPVTRNGRVSDAGTRHPNQEHARRARWRRGARGKPPRYAEFRAGTAEPRGNPQVSATGESSVPPPKRSDRPGDGVSRDVRRQRRPDSKRGWPTRDVPERSPSSHHRRGGSSKTTAGLTPSSRRTRRKGSRPRSGTSPGSAPTTAPTERWSCGIGSALPEVPRGRGCSTCLVGREAHPPRRDRVMASEAAVPADDLLFGAGQRQVTG